MASLSRRRFGGRADCPRLAGALGAGFLIVAADVAPAPEAAPWGLERLMHGLHQVKAASGQFVERKTLHMLSEPLVASGTLIYVAPDQVQKITVLPKRERLALSGDRLTIDGGPEDRPRSLSLADYPEIGAFVEGIRATLAGDQAALERFYTLQLEGNAEDWRLLLRPKASALKDIVGWIRIAGSGNRIRLVETQESDGDRSEMSVVEDIQ
ncbi:MAG TPA: LolA-related protein [Stellaceae bacterium]|nr:LolA-related protein [Stellaceae bacterium]